MGDNKEIRKLTKTPAWKVVKNLEANLKFQELYLEEILKVIALAKVSFAYPIEFDKVERDITNALWNFDKLRNGNKKDSGRQALRSELKKTIPRSDSRLNESKRRAGSIWTTRTLGNRTRLIPTLYISNYMAG